TDKRTSFKSRGIEKTGRLAYVLNIHHPEPRSLFLLSEKQARPPVKYERSTRPVVTSIVASRVVATQCISVSHPSRLYVADDYVGTHKTERGRQLRAHI